MAGQDLTLYVDANIYCPYAMSAFVALAEKRLAFGIERVDLRLGEQGREIYRRLSITCRVPALVHGDFALSESPAINEFSGGRVS